MTRRLLPILGLLALLAAPAAAGGPVYEAQLRTFAEASTVALTTIGRKSGEPRTVTIWFVVDAQGRLYVQSGSGGTTDWYQNLRQTPAVSLLIGELAMTARAEPIDDAAETARVHELYRQKYLRARITGWFGGEVGHGRVVALTDLRAK
jgi:deazaflavin-dependent oxidoreductase (nitroreductase family)